MKKALIYLKKHKKVSVLIGLSLVLMIGTGFYFSNHEKEGKPKQNIAKVEEKKEMKKEEDRNEDKKDTVDNSNVNAKTTDNKPSKKANSSNKKSDSKGSNSAHTHTWKKHTATKQVWVPNIVEVPVYETKIVHGAQFYTFSGYNELGQEEWIANGPIYWFENGFTHDDLHDIIYNALLQSPDGVVDGVLYSHYANIQRYDKVQTGTTKEDQGSYKTENYVDFQYCECGAIK